MSGAADAISGIGLGDIIDFPVDLGSITDIAGTEFMSSFDISSFEIPSFDIPSLGGFDVAGSFAGNAEWFNTFNPGDILKSIPSVGDFNVSSLTNSLNLPSLSSLNTSNIIKTATSTLGINIPSIPGVTGPLNVASLVSSGAAALGINPALLSSATQVLNGASPLSVGASALGINPATVTSLTAKATSLFTTDPNLTNAVDKATGLPINTPREVDAYGLNILGAVETKTLEKNLTPGYVSSLVDSSASTPKNYDQAVASKAALEPLVNEYTAAIATARSNIASNNANIEAINKELADEALPDDRRLLLEEFLQANYENNAVQENTIATNTESLAATSANLAADQTIINTTNASVTTAPDAGEDPYVSNGQTTITAPSAADVKTSPEAVATGVTTGNVSAADLALATDPGTTPGTDTAALVVTARAQQSIRELRNNKAQATDWRVRLRLAPNSTYLYNDDANIGVLAPLKSTDGVIFPYTPSIETAYKASYDQFDLTHSNYRGYFYKNSYVDAVNVRATFTAQDTKEADYLLAVIHFFRSVTKMFYGQDQQRGAPPPLVYLSGYGDYQFNEHPCVVSQFNYTLPPDVDYVRAQSNLQSNTNQSINRLKNPIANNPLAYSVNRLLNSNLLAGALSTRPAQTNNLANGQPTYVPTKMEIAITLLPMQSRSNISNNFSVRGFANGNLLKDGYW